MSRHAGSSAASMSCARVGDALCFPPPWGGVMPVGGNPKKPTRVGEEEEEACLAAREFLALLLPLPGIAIPGEPPPWLFIQLLTRCSGLGKQRERGDVL